MKESIVTKFYNYSNRLLDATTKADAKGVAEMLGRIFAELTKKTAYPYENAFGDFVDFAYMCVSDYYDVIPRPLRGGSRRRTSFCIPIFFVRGATGRIFPR